MSEPKLTPSIISEFGSAVGMSEFGRTDEIRQKNAKTVSRMLEEFPGIDDAHKEWREEMRILRESRKSGNPESI